jgi:amino acid adenylation domain-containing protein
MTDDVVNLVRAQVRRDPDRPAVRWRGESLTYADLWHRAGVVTARLSDHARPGDVVGVCASRSADLVVAILGILRAGCAYLPLDASYPRPRLAFMLDQAGVGALVGHREAAEALAGERALIPLDRLDERMPAPDDPPIAADDVAYVMFTSGSTGHPKGVMQTHGALSNLIRWQVAESAVGAGEVTAQFAPISFDVSFQEIFATLAAGGVLLCLDDNERRDPVLLVRRLARERVARLFLPFVMLRTVALFVDELSEGLPPLREVVTAGEQLRCDDPIRRMFTKLPGCRLVNQYGPTETHVCTSYSLPADPAAWPLLPPIGTPIDGVRVYVLDPDGRPVPDGQPGELHVGGVAVARGYIGRPDLTRQRFRAEPGGSASMYATGDVVERRDGQLHYLGRDDDQIKISGIRVEPAEIVREILSFPGVREAAVVARKDAGSEVRLVGFVTGDLDPAGLADLRHRLAGCLPAHLVPHRILPLPALPTTPSGKVDRAALLDAARDGQELPADATTLAAIWQAEVGPADNGADDLRAGGVDSLAAARVAAGIARQLRVLVPVDRVLAARSLDHLAEIVASSPPVGPVAAIEPVGPRPVTAMQRQIFIAEMWEVGPSHWVLAELDVTGPFDPAGAERAIRALTRRHAALRTRFDFTGPDITQEYLADAGPLVSHTDSVDLAVLRERRLADRYPFGDVAAPVVDIVRLGDRHHRILLRLHHACCDGWSLALLLDEFAALYGGTTLPAAPQPWQPTVSDGVVEGDLGYWLERLAPAAGRPPVDWGRARGPSTRLRRVPVALGGAEVDAVRRQAIRARATPFAVMLAAWASLFDQGDEVCVAVPVATRTTPQDAGCVGLFLNTLVLPLATGAETFTDLVERTQRDVAAARRHQTAPLPDILRHLAVDLEAGHHPLAQMMFVLQPPGPRHWTLPRGARAELVLDVGVPEATGFDVVLNVDDRGDRIDGWLDYDAGAIDADRVAALTDRWLRALKG